MGSIKFHLLNENKQFIFAHRGFTSLYPENTLESIEYALDDIDIDGVELDLTFTKDKKIVIFHDKNLERLFKRSDKINELDEKCLRELDITGKIGLKDISYNRKYKIIFLDDLINIIEKYPKKIFNLELKYYSHDLNLLNEFKNIITKNLQKFDSQIIYTSFNLDLIQNFSMNSPNYKTGMLIHKQEKLVEFLKKGTFVDYLILNKNLDLSIINNKFYIGVYTLNSNKYEDEDPNIEANNNIDSVILKNDNIKIFIIDY
ncbi:Glycerophosphoryl diester phosphodiesterase family [seawater metagenome]|uniref:Glycerophosphoryl diester phosphodiesterase family n=1 Tax=seawater metagenome TaxID=1561972 RepID=A0A5E8CHT2_9ZZZZ